MTDQSLLFRDFPDIYEGNELDIGFFFFSWLLWVGLGALTGRKSGRWECLLRKGFEFQPLLYLPAFFIQQAIIANSRWLAGIKSFELFPFFKMFPVSLLACAPVSLVTGYLFTAGCSWLLTITGGKQTITTVYTIESLGSFCAGVRLCCLPSWLQQPASVLSAAPLENTCPAACPCL